jgi:uncharacterized RDD family membrane protein YckC
MEEFEQETQAIPVRYAAVWQRVLAYLIDGLILSFPSLIILVVCNYIFDIAPDSRLFDQIQNVSSVVITVLYFSLLETSSLRGTFGKQAMGLYTADMYGQAVTYRQAFIRNCIRSASYLILIYGTFAFTESFSFESLTNQNSEWYTANLFFTILNILDYSGVISTRYRQTIHDYVAGTVVLRR